MPNSLKISKEDRIEMLTELKLERKIWAAFFQTYSDEAFASSAYRSFFADLYMAELRGRTVDRKQLENLLPEKDKRTKEKRVGELLSDKLVNAVDLSGGDGDEVVNGFQLCPRLKQHMNLYLEYAHGKVTEADDRIRELLAAD